MKKFHEIEEAEIDDEELFGQPSRKGELISKLRAEGFHPIAVGRAVIVIEQCEEKDEIPVEAEGWKSLRLSIYSDPDVYDEEKPRYVFIQANKYGMPSVFLQILNSENKERIFKLEEKLIRDEF
jgi:hypothetical protein